MPIDVCHSQAYSGKTKKKILPREKKKKSPPIATQNKVIYPSLDPSIFEVKH